MTIGCVIRIVSENNQNMIKFQNHKTLCHQHPKIMCVIDKIKKSRFSVPDPLSESNFHLVYSMHMNTHYNLFKIFSKRIFSLSRQFVTIFDTYFPRIFSVSTHQSTHQTSYG